MPLDAMTLGAVTAQLNQTLAGARIEKIYQPDREEIVLLLRGVGFHKKLLISAAGAMPRIHVTQQSRENPSSPPMFCMLLRKHLQGAKICSITQPGWERMAVIEMDTLDEMGVAAKKYLACELMGRYSNIILYGEDQRIIDCIRRVDSDLSGKRQVLPGLFYRLPPPQDKQDLLSCSAPGILAAIHRQTEEVTLERWLLERFAGLSPLLCRELSFRATGDVSFPLSRLVGEREAALLREIDALSRRIASGQTTPVLLWDSDEGRAMDFSMQPIYQYGSRVENRVMEDFSALLCEFYDKKDRQNRQKKRGQELTRLVSNALERARRKQLAQTRELQKTESREEKKRMGDLIIANLHQIEPGMKRATVTDYYSEGCPEVTISLDLRLTPQQNAQQYYKQYNKAKTAQQMLAQQLRQGEADIEYLESVLVQIAQCENESDFNQIRQELQQTGYLTQKKGKRTKTPPSRPFVYDTPDGFVIYAGKNNVQNDLLTLKTARKSDIWFHTQKIHGSHVILSCEGREPSEAAMTMAAQIAAYHSKARSSAGVPVDYTPVKFVKKPAGAKPGMVIYHVYQTAYVTPEEQQVERLRRRV